MFKIMIFTKKFTTISRFLYLQT